ncbi:hypothetical protein C2857_003710 [Epichloe festucae Fl1]|uniref:Calcineurin-like phosphoesterase domain-containing protein n=1 Tax=Epichloe festucae (strain Fl1) TaxID=877507 RepID=A0A7S9PV88_EPIFF|nr:hypothetical protein C2857_003710 [Epichloe festucae Fl1]
MAIQLLSDLHLEAPKAYDIFDIVPKAPYLALLGDIGNVVPHKHDYLGFLKRQLKLFRAVLFVPGNHEAYHSSWPDAVQVLRAFAQEVGHDSSLGEFVLLNRSDFRLPDTNIVILGCSLFSFIPPESQRTVGAGINDFYQIRDWDVDAHNEAHRQDLSWLNEQVTGLEQSHVEIVILSHWSPSDDPRSMDPRHAGSPIVSGFSTDLREEACFKSGKVKVWAFGHTHYNCDFLLAREEGVEPLRLVANQRGYYFAQAAGYDGEKTVRI